MSRLAQLGFKQKYFEERDLRGWTNLEEIGAIYSDVLETMTNYKTEEQILKLAKDAGSRADFSYTKNFCLTKLSSFIGGSSSQYAAPTWVDTVAFPFLKRLASVTLVLQKN